MWPREALVLTLNPKMITGDLQEPGGQGGQKWHGRAGKEFCFVIFGSFPWWKASQGFREREQRRRIVSSWVFWWFTAVVKFPRGPVQIVEPNAEIICTLHWPSKPWMQMPVEVAWEFKRPNGDIAVGTFHFSLEKWEDLGVPDVPGNGSEFPWGALRMI